jgi:hypothetical protein
LSDAYAVTDYYCQGVSFKLDAWLAHLKVPPTVGGLRRPAVFVVLTRWGAWEQVTLLRLLWAAGDTVGREKVIDQFYELACLEPDLKKRVVSIEDSRRGGEVEVRRTMGACCSSCCKMSGTVCDSAEYCRCVLVVTHLI